MHGLFGGLEFFTEVRFLLDELIFLFQPVLLRECEAVAQTGELFRLFCCFRVKVCIVGREFVDLGRACCVLLLEFGFLFFEFVDAGARLGQIFLLPLLDILAQAGMVGVSMEGR